MADPVLSADDVGRVLLYIAPGFFARCAYEARFPQRDHPPLEMLIWSVAASFPLVALANVLADELQIVRAVGDLPYVLLLLGTALVVGYLTAIARTFRWLRTAFGKLGLRHQPEGSIYAQTLLAASKHNVVTVEFINGKKLSGTPRAGPSLADEGIEELYLTHPAWKTSDAWEKAGAGEGIIVRLQEVRTITLSEDPLAGRVTP